MAIFPIHNGTDAVKPTRVGGKASNLMLLADNFLVPAGFVITQDGVMDEKMIVAAFNQLKVQRVAVRSSAVNEDGAKAAWAGQLETILNVTRDDLLDAIRLCKESDKSERAQAYAHRHGVPAGGVAVLVQQMLEPTASGVAFSRHPVTGERAVIVESVTGLGDMLVSGEVTPDTYIIQGEKVDKLYIAGDKPTLSNGLLLQLTTQVRAIEQHLGYAVDIEWAIQDNDIYVLQARPITTL